MRELQLQGKGKCTVADKMDCEFWDYSQNHNHHDIPENVPERFQEIISSCWKSNPIVRPTAEELLGMYF